jgi:tRNA-specific 2-thiouridylase
VTLVTGHYASVIVDDDGPHLFRAIDRSKDQSYMLAGLRVDQLASIIMPLGNNTKEQTRVVAREFGLDIAEKPDSVDLCFVDGDYRAFIAQRFPQSFVAGPVVTLEGEEVGRHTGLANYTVGQRKGLPETLADGPWYVLRTDRLANSVIIGRRGDLARKHVVCSATNVIRASRFAQGIVSGLAVCRYRSAGIPARAWLTVSSQLAVEFDEAVPLLTPGQLLVLYDDNDREVLASGVIER